MSIFSEGMFMQKVNYIHLNPVRANLVDKATDYRWSSARIWQRRHLADEPLMVDFDQIEWRRAQPSGDKKQISRKVRDLPHIGRQSRERPSGKAANRSGRKAANRSEGKPRTARGRSPNTLRAHRY